MQHRVMQKILSSGRPFETGQRRLVQKGERGQIRGVFENQSKHTLQLLQRAKVSFEEKSHHRRMRQSDFYPIPGPRYQCQTNCQKLFLPMKQRQTGPYGTQRRPSDCGMVAAHTVGIELNGDALPSLDLSLRRHSLPFNKRKIRTLAKPGTIRTQCIPVTAGTPPTSTISFYQQMTRVGCARGSVPHTVPRFAASGRFRS